MVSTVAKLLPEIPACSVAIKLPANPSLNDISSGVYVSCLMNVVCGSSAFPSCTFIASVIISLTRLGAIFPVCNSIFILFV